MADSDSYEQKLTCRAIFHVVGPSAFMSNAHEWLVKTFSECLTMAGDRGDSRICFPAIGTGYAGISPVVCATAFFESVKKSWPPSIERIVLLCNDVETLRLFSCVYEKIIST